MKKKFECIEENGSENNICCRVNHIISKQSLPLKKLSACAFHNQYGFDEHHMQKLFYQNIFIPLAIPENT